MNDITKTGVYTGIETPVQREVKKPSVEAGAEEKPASDQVTLSTQEESLARKIIHFPGKVLGAAVGAVTGTVTSPLHVVPGAVKGIQEGVATHKGSGSEALFHMAHWGQNLAIGAGAGFAFGGPIGAGIGAGAAALLTGVTTFIGEKSDAYDKMVGKVETEVGKAVSDNTGPKVKVVIQNATEGAIIGAGAAAKSGMGVGYDAGKGIVEGAFASVEGLAEGVYEAGKSVINDIKNPAAQQPEQESGKKDISRFRKVTEKIIGSPASLVSAAANTVGGIFGGGVSGVSSDKSDSSEVHAAGSFISYIGMGAAGGAMVAGIPGSIVGGIAGGIFGAAAAASKSLDKIGEKVDEKANKAVSDNKPSDSKVKDAVMNFTEGAVVGAAHGGVNGLVEGTNYGAGIVSGVIEGAKGAVGGVLGTYEKEEAKKTEASAGEKPSLGKQVLDAVTSAPRNLSKLAAGTAMGVLGAGRGAVSGLIEGSVDGLKDTDHVNVNFHQSVMAGQVVLGSAAAGFALGGPVGAGIGALTGLGAAYVETMLNDRSGSSRKAAEGINDAVDHAQKDNVYKNEPDKHGHVEKTSYETFRDGVEGAITGAGAGVREGFREGFQEGSGLADGVFDGAKYVAKGVKYVAKGVYQAAKGVAKGVVGSFQGAPKPEEPVNPQVKPEAEESLGKKIIGIPGKVVKGIAGAAVGAVTTPLHILPGAAKGIQEAMAGHKGSKGLEVFHGTMYTQNILLGAGAGFMVGGPVGALIGGGAGAAATGLTHYMGSEKTETYPNMSKELVSHVDHAIKDNKGTPIESGFQDVTEGTIIGGTVGAKHGFKVGYETGEGVVSGVVDTLEGVLEGVYESGKNAVNLIKGEKPQAEKQDK